MMKMVIWVMFLKSIILRDACLWSVTVHTLLALPLLVCLRTTREYITDDHETAWANNQFVKPLLLKPKLNYKSTVQILADLTVIRHTLNKRVFILTAAFVLLGSYTLIPDSIILNQEQYCRKMEILTVHSTNENPDIHWEKAVSQSSLSGLYDTNL